MSTILTCLVVSIMIPSAFASNDTTVATVGWMADPTGRGTFSLVTSCLFTLGLCVWTAMHLNVPPIGESRSQTWMRNIKWGLIGIFAPELVVYAAWRQYNSAKQLCAEMKRLNKSTPQVLGTKSEQNLESSSVGRIRSRDSVYPWTMVHSFYAGMGGFVIDLEPTSQTCGIPIVDGIRFLTLTPRGIALLARCGLLPNIQEGEIVDKSKADGSTKSLACLQAGWMIVQVISRVVYGLPVTLLEVNILGHILCALIMYILWWHKPRLVQKPTRLTGDWTRAVGAYMYMSSHVSGRISTHAGVLRRTWVVPELSDLGLCMGQTQEELSLHEAASSTGSATYENDDLRDVGASNTLESWPSYFRPRPEPRSESLLEDLDVAASIKQPYNMINIQHARRRMAEDAIKIHPEIRRRFVAIASTSDWREPIVEELVTKTAPNWPGEDLLRGTGSLVMGMILWFASIAYGGVHIAAWNDYYPSTIEAWMWRSSSVWVSFSGLVWLVINSLAYIFKPVDRYWDRVLAFQARRRSYFILGTTCFLCGVAYLFARIFLVVEAWISIRRLPLAAYKTPVGIQTVPHI